MEFGTSSPREGERDPWGWHQCSFASRSQDGRLDVSGRPCPGGPGEPCLLMYRLAAQLASTKLFPKHPGKVLSSFQTVWATGGSVVPWDISRVSPFLWRENRKVSRRNLRV